MSKTKTLKSSTKASAKRAPAAKIAPKKAGASKVATAKPASKKSPPARKASVAKKAMTARSATKTKKTTKTASGKAPAKKTISTAKRLSAQKSATIAKKANSKKPTAKIANVKPVMANSANKPKATAKPTAAKRVRAKSRRKKSEIVLPEGYQPSTKEPFMNDQQQAYFRRKLIAWKEDIIRQTRETLVGLTAASEQHADVSDRATSETDRALELRARDRQRKLVAKINSAIARLDEGLYGYCEESGEPIGLRRLEARPIATLSLEAQERHERRERVFRED